MDCEQAVQLLALARQAEPDLSGPQPEVWTERLEEQHEQLQAALHWFLDQGAGEQALGFAAALWRFWFLGGHVSEGRAALNAALSAPGADTPTAARAKALYGAGLLAFRQGDNAACRRLSAASLAVAREVGDREAEVNALVGLARAALRDENLPIARARSEEAMAIARAVGNRGALTRPLHLLAAVTQLDGNYEAARALYEESVALHQELGDVGFASAERANLASVERQLGHLDRATALLRESLQTAYERRSLQDLPYMILGLGAVAAAGGSAARAARLLAASEALYEASGVVMDPDDRQTFEQSVALVRAALNEAEFQAAWAEGRAMSVERAVDYALHGEEIE